MRFHKTPDNPVALLEILRACQIGAQGVRAEVFVAVVEAAIHCSVKDRPDPDPVDTHFGKVIELAYGRVKRAFLREGLNAEFHDDERLDPVRRHLFESDPIIGQQRW